MIKKNYGFKLIYKKHKDNKGLSVTLETGLNILNNKLKQNDLIVSLDCDDTHPVEIIPKMLKKLIWVINSLLHQDLLPSSKVNGLSYFREMMSVFRKIFLKFYIHLKT